MAEKKGILAFRNDLGYLTDNQVSYNKDICIARWVPITSQGDLAMTADKVVIASDLDELQEHLFPGTTPQFGFFIEGKSDKIEDPYYLQLKYPVLTMSTSGWSVLTLRTSKTRLLEITRKHRGCWVNGRLLDNFDEKGLGTIDGGFWYRGPHNSIKERYLLAGYRTQLLYEPEEAKRLEKIRLRSRRAVQTRRERKDIAREGVRNLQNGLPSVLPKELLASIGGLARHLSDSFTPKNVDVKVYLTLREAARGSSRKRFDTAGFHYYSRFSNGSYLDDAIVGTKLLEDYGISSHMTEQIVGTVALTICVLSRFTQVYPGKIPTSASIQARNLDRYLRTNRKAILKSYQAQRRRHAEFLKSHGGKDSYSSEVRAVHDTNSILLGSMVAIMRILPRVLRSLKKRRVFLEERNYRTTRGRQSLSHRTWTKGE